MATYNVTATAPNYTGTSLYVDNLHPDVTEVMLFNKFASAGPIFSIYVCRDIITCQSLGYAYVNFIYPADAERALHTMNFDILLGYPIGIWGAPFAPESYKSGVGSIFIKNLPENFNTKSLYDTFSAFGNILYCKVMTDKNGQSKRFGFVHFETQKAADDAINKVNGMLLADKKVCVGCFMTRNQRTDVDEPREFTNVFIKNYDDEIDEEKLRELLSKYGKILAFKFETNEHGHSKGFAFCNYEKPEQAEAAVKNLNGYSIGDKELYVGRLQKKSERLAEIKGKRDLQRQERMNKYQGVNLYIKNLDDTIDDERLREEFSKFGTVTSAKVMLADGRSKGVGFICFSAPEEAVKAVVEMNGSVVGSKELYVALAQRKEERRMHLTNEHMQRIAASRVPPLTHLPFPNEMSTMMSDPPGSMCPSQLRNMLPSNPCEFSTPVALANATVEEQKQILVKRLFPLIQEMQPELAHKITGIFLELDNTEILHMLESRESFKVKIEEVVAVIRAEQHDAVKQTTTNSVVT